MSVLLNVATFKCFAMQLLFARFELWVSPMLCISNMRVSSRLRSYAF